MADEGSSARKTGVKVVVGLLALLLGLGGGYWFATRDDGSTSSDASGEIFLSPAADVA